MTVYAARRVARCYNGSSAVCDVQRNDVAGLFTVLTEPGNTLFSPKCTYGVRSDSRQSRAWTVMASAAAIELCRVGSNAAVD